MKALGGTSGKSANSVASAPTATGSDHGSDNDDVALNPIGHSAV